MSITINYFLANKNKLKTAKELSISGIVQYSFDDANGSQKRRFKFATGEKSPVKGFKNGKVDGRVENASNINSSLATFRKDAIKLYQSFKNNKNFPTPEAFRTKLLSGVTEVTEDRNFKEDFKLFIEYHDNKGSSESTLKNLKLTQAKLLDMSAKAKYPLDYATINLDFYGKFKKYCDKIELPDGSIGLKKNTFGGHINRLKMFLNHANAEGWNKYQFYKHDKFEVLREEIPVTTLTKDEIETLANLDLSNRKKDENGINRLGLSRDFFLLGCETGLRYVDYSKINKKSITEVENGYNLRIKTQKTQTEVVIPLSHLAMEILLRYNFELPEPPHNQKLNENLKVIMKEAKIGKSISTHDARRTFCTIEYNSGTPVAWLMLLSSHKTESQFFKYIGLDKTANAEKVRDMHDKYKVTKKGLLDSKLKVA